MNIFPFSLYVSPISTFFLKLSSLLLPLTQQPSATFFNALLALFFDNLLFISIIFLLFSSSICDSIEVFLQFHVLYRFPTICAQADHWNMVEQRLLQHNMVVCMVLKIIGPAPKAGIWILYESADSLTAVSNQQFAIIARIISRAANNLPLVGPGWT